MASTWMRVTTSKVGFSDHALGVFTLLVACAMACVAPVSCLRGKGDAALKTASSLGVHSRRPDLHFSGRFEHGPQSSRFSWSGSNISARVVANSVSVDLAESVGSNYYYVVVDGKPLAQKLVTQKGRRGYELVRELGAGVHHVTLHRLTEAWIGETEFFGFALNEGGEFKPYGKPPTRRIEAIGDSITAGYGNEGDAATCPFTPAGENHYLTYNAIAARNLGAELVTVAWSGKGVFSNRGDTTDLETVPVLWQRTLAERADSRWNFAAYQPDAVVINLGTNDLTPENPNWSPFAEAYLGFVRDVRSRYRDATIFCALGPMLSDNYPPGRRALSLARDAILSVIAKFEAAGDRKVHLVEFPEQNDAIGYGCDWHPNLKQHALMAAQLESEFRKKLNW